jgi:hypothetical protein
VASDAARCLDLTGEPPAKLRLLGELPADQLDRDGTAADGPPEIHLTHAAMPQAAQQTISPDLDRVTGL